MGRTPASSWCAQRLKLLRRERERQSLRWNQFQLLMAGKAPMPEPGFAKALYYQVSGDAEAGRQAVAWALGAGADLRQLALVFDWCQDILTEAQSKALAAKLARAHPAKPPRLVGSRGALAPAGCRGSGRACARRPGTRDANRWCASGGKARSLPALNGGREALARDDTYALMEILHVVRDNFDVGSARGARRNSSRDLPMVQLLSYYPATYPAGENDYRIPAAPHSDEPSRTCAAPRFPAPPN